MVAAEIGHVSRCHMRINCEKSKWMIGVVMIMMIYSLMVPVTFSGNVCDAIDLTIQLSQHE